MRRVVAAGELCSVVRHLSVGKSVRIWDDCIIHYRERDSQILYSIHGRVVRLFLRRKVSKHANIRRDAILQWGVQNQYNIMPPVKKPKSAQP
jgi:hypothetical protein